MRLVADRRERLDRFLARQMPQFSRTRLAAFIGEGGVRLDGLEAKPGVMLKPGWIVEVEEVAERPAHDLTPVNLPLAVLYEDGELLVVDKPRGLAAHPSPTLKGPSLVNVLLARGQPLSTGAAPFRPGIVHRLDRDTTGLMVVAKNDVAHGRLARQFAAKTAKRRYLAWLDGELEHERTTVEAPLARDAANRFLMAVDPSGKSAISHFRRLRRGDRGTLASITLETGRTHQIRAHAKAFGHPVLGDRLYAPSQLQGWPLQLHAAMLDFDHPSDGRRLSFVVPPPSDFLQSETLDEEAIRRIFADDNWG